ncbi:MAG: hypothetical protein ABH836_06660 [Candidatus Omnitrophota bacterium]
MTNKITPVDLKKIKTISIKTRTHKARIADFAKTATDYSMNTFFESLPKILKANDLRKLIDKIIIARKEGRPVILACGDAVIKVGLSTLIIDLLKRKIITAVAMQGAGVIHDTEIALIGETSEDVGISIQDGTFGMAEETGKLLNAAIKEGAAESMGLGEAAGRKLAETPFAEYSIAANCYKLGVPLTVHVAIGTDTIHMHPDCDGAALGKTSHTDFRKFASVVSELEGGVIINIASAVILPEVFLKALSVARNLGAKVEKFTAANIDMIMHYRPTENVVKRPTQSGGSGFSITGNIEIIFPLLYAGIIEKAGIKK